jgi:hypothetical protein
MLGLFLRVVALGTDSLLVVVAVGLALVFAGVRAICWVRAFGEREQLRRCAAVHFGPIGSASDGPCTVAGRWQPLTPTSSLVIDGTDALLVEHAATPAIADRPRVFVFGRIEGAVDDPRAVGFRQSARLPRLVVGEHHGVLDTLAPPAWYSSLVIAAHLCGVPLIAAGLLAVGYGASIALVILALSHGAWR